MAGLDTNVSPHVLQYTCATLFEQHLPTIGKNFTYFGYFVVKYLQRPKEKIIEIVQRACFGFAYDMRG